MSVSVTRPTELPVLEAVFFDPFDGGRDISDFFNEVTHFRGDSSEVFYFLMDLSQINMGFSDVLVGMARAAKAAREVKGPNVERISKPVVVGAGKLVQLIADSFNQGQYGKITIPVFDDSEKARAYIREQILETN